MVPQGSTADLAVADWLVVSGDMAEQIRVCAWSRTPLGARQAWPQSLRTAVNLVLGNGLPMALFWGPELVLLHNDAYQDIVDAKQPRALGLCFRSIWPEAWEATEPIFAAVMERGEALLFADQVVPLIRRGHVESASFTLCYSPVRVEDGTVGGTLVTLQETTAALESTHLLRRSEAKHLTILETVRSGYVLLDLEGRLREVNEEYSRMSGYSRAELLEMRVSDLEARQSPAEILAHIRTIRGHGQEQFETRLRRKDGSIYDAEVRATYVDIDGGLVVVFVWEISDRKATEEALRESQRDLNRAQEVARMGSWRLDTRRNELLWSDETYRIFGVPKGTPLTYEAFMAAVHPDDRGRVHEQWAAALEGRPYDIEHRILVGGAVKWVHERAELEFDERGSVRGGFGTVQDITEIKEAEAALLRREMTLAQAGQMAHLGAWDSEIPDQDELRANPLVWSEAVRLTWSDETYRIFGYEPGAVQATADLFFEHVHPADRQRVADALARAMLAGQAYSIEHRIVRRDGTVRIVQEHAELMLDEHGKARRLIGAVQDVTERKALEDRLREADRRKDEFLGMLSHELRNPLMPVRNSLYILERASPGGEQARRAQTVINRQVDHLARLVDDLLDVTRIARGKIQLQRKRVELNAVVARTVEDHRSLFAEREITLQAELTTEPLFVFADPTRLAQLVGNLLQNAAKFTGCAGRTTVETRREGGGLDAVVRVRDTGAGIPPELLGQLFVPFTQADHTLHRSRGGLGLGLALVKGLVELHGGRVGAHSEGIGKGAEFIVYLPLVAEKRAEAGGALPGEDSGAGVGRRVLIIEDNVDGADTLRTALELQKNTVDVAYDGPTGLMKLATFRPEVVLCDIGLPGMNGYDVARAIRSRPDCQGLHLVAVTGYAQPEETAKARQAGFDHHLVKPPDLEKLQKLLASASDGG